MASSFLPSALPDASSSSVDDAESHDVFFINGVDADCDESRDTEPSIVSSVISSTKDTPSLPKVPSKSILKACTEEEIPICLKKKSWRTMSVPNLHDIKMKRIGSLSSFVDLASLNEETPTTTTSLPKSDSKVEFRDITVRDYPMTIGDNPCVSYGTPVSLDWDYEEKQPLDLDLYEAERGTRRSLRQMNINYYQRRNILIHKCGFTEEEVQQAKREAKKTKNQRALTSVFVPFGKIEEAGESIIRKTKRAFQRDQNRDQGKFGSTITTSTSAFSLGTLSTI